MARSRTDALLLFATRITRLFAYGFLSVVLALYLAQVGLREYEIGLLFTCALAGDAAISLWITTSADRIGRRGMLILGASLMAFAGLMFLTTTNFVFLIIAAVIGVISPSGNEIGPFLSIEQAALSQLLPNHQRTRIFAWYNLAGSFATASGALAGGWLSHNLQKAGTTPVAAYQAVLIGYASAGLVLGALFLGLSHSVEPGFNPTPSGRVLGLHRSKRIVIKLSALFALDAFAGGFVVQSIMAYWFHVKFGIDEAALGNIFFGANILAGVSALLAARVAARIGLVRTMVFTHLPSNLLLCLVPFMPGLSLAVGLLLLRFSISQMDVPTRQSYTMAVVAADERSAASGVTTIARSVGASLSPALSGALLASPLLMGAPFVIAGGLKIIYDLLLYRSFRALAAPEEMAAVRTK